MICLDSDCIIDFLKNKSEAVSLVNKHGGQIVTTVVNQFEVFFGIYNKQTLSVKEESVAFAFFASLPVLSLQDGQFAAELFCVLMKKGEQINQNDALIAAILRSHSVSSIATRNTKHFSKIAGLSVVSY